MRHATYLPVCRRGRPCSRQAGLGAEPPLVIVTDLQGGCAHASAFGELEGQPLEEAWR